VTPPDRRPGPVRAVATLVLPLSLAVGAGAVGVANTHPSASAAERSATTTSNPWVPGVNGTMTVGIDRAPTGCNPNSVSGDTWANRLVLEPVLPSAFFVNGNDQAVYDPATITQAELQSTTPETVVYSVNPKAVWSDGRPLTAEDFIYTWEEERGVTGPIGPPASNKTPKTPSSQSPTSNGAPAATTPSAGTVAGTPTPAAVTKTLPGATGTTGPEMGYRQIASIKPSNHGRTFTVVFKRPYADWQSLFDDLLPAHVLKKTGWNPQCSTINPSIDLSAGPFVIAKVVPNHEIVLVRNRRWWQQQPNLARLIIMFASGPQQLAHWLRDGTIDVALPSGYGTGYLQTVTSQPSLASQSQLSSTFLELQFSTVSPVAAPIDLRQAVAHAIDRESLIDKVAGWADSTVVPAASQLFAQTQNGYPPHKPPPLQVSGQPGYTPTTVSTKSPTATPFPATADLPDTNKLLIDLGYVKGADGFWKLITGSRLVLRMAVDIGDPWAQQSASDLGQQLQAAGIAVEEIPAPDAQAAGLDLTTGRADAALLPMHASPYASQAISWYTPLLGTAGTGGSQDWSGFDDPSVNALLEKASEELNPVDAAPIYSEVDSVLWQDMVGLPLFTQPSLLAWSGNTSGVSSNPNLSGLLWSIQSWSMRVPPTSAEAQP